MASVLQRFGLTRGPSPRDQEIYEHTVLQTARGIHVGPADLARALKGRTEADFRADIDRYLRRVQAAAEWKQGESDRKEHQAMLADVRRAQAEIDQLPIVKMLAELEAKKRQLGDAQARATGYGTAVAQRRSQAGAVLDSTADKGIRARTAALGAEANELQRQRSKVALTADELERHALAKADVERLPKQIAAFQLQTNPESATEAVNLTIRLNSAQQLLADYASRIKEVERFDAKIGKISAEIERTANERFAPEAMEFVSKPVIEKP